MKNILILFALIITFQVVGVGQTLKIGSKEWYAEAKKSIEEEKLFGKAWDKRNKKDYKGAIKDYTKIIALKPKSTYAYLYRGNVKAILKDYNGAIDDYNKAIEIDAVEPSHVTKSAYLDRGRAKFALGDNIGACLDWKKAEELGAESNVADLIKEHCK